MFETYKLPDSLQFVARIVPADTDANSYDAQILAGLSAALVPLEASALDRKIYYQTYAIAPPPKTGLLGRKKPAKDWTPPAEIDPWNEETRDFWSRVGRNPDLHPAIKRWLDAALGMLERVNKLSRSTDGLWEYDEAQFAEPAVSVLAMVHPDFVPYYTRFLTVWDMHHEVAQHDVILQILEMQGITEATEDLIIVRSADGIGQHGFDTFAEVLPQLQEHYGDLARSDFLARLVTYHHAYAVARHADHLRHAFDYYKRDLLRNRNAHLPEVSRRLDAWFLENQPSISQAAMPLFEALEQKRLASG